MDAVKEAVLEQKIDDLALRFEQTEERNREEHREIRAEICGGRDELHGEIRGLGDELHGEIRGLRGDLRGEIRDVRGEIQHLNRTVALGFASIAASVVGAAGAAIVANSV